MKILVIDDDQGMTDLLTILLTPASSKILVANNSQAGLCAVKEEQPDAVILDLMLPELEGWEVCRSIREISNVPILILSAIDAPGMVAQALDNGADDYLTKPISSGTLIAHLNRLVRRYSPSQRNKIITESRL